MHTQNISAGSAQNSGMDAVTAAAAYAAASSGDVEPPAAAVVQDGTPEVMEVAPEVWPHAVYGESGLTLALKHINEGNNPREYFDEEKMKELEATIAIYGVFTSILLRYKDGKYFIVAGHRRFRASMKVLGEDYCIPVRIQTMTDAVAEQLALIENTARDDMSAIEEAKSASRALGRTKGDREEAARIVGMKLSTFNSRLQLMNCSPAVQQAAIQREIKLGHAELLAGLAKDIQDTFLPVLIKEKRTVEELKAVIAQAASQMETAIFDKTECGACPSNSSIQSVMFADSISDGCCTNPTCFTKKTEVELQRRADEMKDEYPVVRIIRVGENETRTKLVAEGSKGVGATQAEACRACSNFGAVVSGLPQGLGSVYKDQCFDTACNAKMVAARITKDKAQSGAGKSAPSGKGSTAKGAEPASKGSTTKGAKDEKPAEVVSIHATDRIKDYRVKLWRRAMMSEISNAPELSSKYLLALSLNGSARHISSTMLGNAYKSLSGNEPHTVGSGLDKWVEGVMALEGEAASQLTTLLAASAMEQLDVHLLQQLASTHQVDLTKYWKLDKEFLDLLTKSQIQYIGKEVGLAEEFGDNYEKLFSLKVPDLVEKILGVESFDYSAKIPAVLAY